MRLRKYFINVSFPFKNEELVHYFNKIIWIRRFEMTHLPRGKLMWVFYCSNLKSKNERSVRQLKSGIEAKKLLNALTITFELYLLR